MEKSIGAVRNASYEDMAAAAEIMVVSFRTAFRAFVSPETMAACTNPDNCRRMLEDIFQEGKMRFLMGGSKGFLCWQETLTGRKSWRSIPARKTGVPAWVMPC